MTADKIASSVFILFAGVGVFLLALKMLSENLEQLSGNKLKSLFNKTSKSKLLGVGIGTVATAAIQSSGAVSVMIIGFVNAGLMSLGQAATMIFGANIGTTITGQIVALGLLGGGGFKIDVVFAAFAGLGAAITLFAKKDRTKSVAGLMTGFGLLFVALSVMSSAMAGFSEMPAFINFLASIQNPLLLVIIGAAFTALIQSSSAMTGIAITMLFGGLISLDQGIYITLGSNIGSCVVALIAGIGSSTNAKRTALIHLIFNIFGVIAFLIVDQIMRAATPDGVTFGTLLQVAFPGVPATQLAMLHTFFNVATVIVILPFTNLLVKLVTKIIPDKKHKANPDEPHLYFIEKHMISTPPIAVQQAKNEIVNMAEIAMRNFHLSLETICTLNFDRKKEFEKDEIELNYLNRELVRFIVELSKTKLSETDHTYLSTTYRSITDLERIGDYAENIMEYAAILKDSDKGFSADAVEETKELQELIENLYQKVMKTYVNDDLTALKEAFELEDEVDSMTDELSRHHIERLDRGVCTPEVGAQYLSLTANAERVADHFINVAKSILVFAKTPKDQKELQKQLMKKKNEHTVRKNDKTSPSNYGSFDELIDTDFEDGTDVKKLSVAEKNKRKYAKFAKNGAVAVATNNKHKLVEIREILGTSFTTLLSLEDLDINIEIEETGSTLTENALIKARAITELTGLTSIADDSGLMVDALDGAPGVYSARYAGPEHDNKKNNSLLLKNLRAKNRSAHFCSVIALTYADGTYMTAEGRVDGKILRSEKGQGGFGYDPLFYSTELKKTFAEASAEEKNSVSHRGRALRAMLEKLTDKNN